MLSNRNSCCRVELDSTFTCFSIFLALCKHISKTTSCSEVFWIFCVLHKGYFKYFSGYTVKRYLGTAFLLEMHFLYLMLSLISCGLTKPILPIKYAIKLFCLVEYCMFKQQKSSLLLYFKIKNSTATLPSDSGPLEWIFQIYSPDYNTEN